MAVSFVVAYSSFEKQLFSFKTDEEIYSIGSTASKTIVLDSKGFIFVLNQTPSLTLAKEIFNFDIIQISCNKNAFLFLSSLGQVFSQGEDTKKSGFLGTGRFSSMSPTQIPNLSSIISISLGKNHAGALSDIGLFYMWGTCHSTNNSPLPSKHSFDLFSIQEFECANDYTLITTPGGYLYVIGKLRLTHNILNNNFTGGIISPPGIERLCIRLSRAGYKFVTCVTDSGDIYAFDGCFELVKLPLPSYHRIDDLRVSGQNIIGNCEDNYVLEWKMTENLAPDCKIYTFSGQGYKTNNKIKLTGVCKDKIFALSQQENPIQNKFDVFQPYKRTEFGQKLIEKAKKSVRASGGMSILRSSMDSSPIIKSFRNLHLQKCQKLVYAINLILKKPFSVVKIYCSSKIMIEKLQSKSIVGILKIYCSSKIMIEKLQSKSIVGILYEYFAKSEFRKKNCFFTKLKLHTEKYKKLRNLLKDAANIIFYRAYLEIIKSGFTRIKIYFKAQVMIKLFEIFENIQIKQDLRKLKEIDLKVVMKKGFSVWQDLEVDLSEHCLRKKLRESIEKKIKKLSKSVGKLFSQNIYQSFMDIKAYTSMRNIHEKIFIMHKSRNISRVFLILQNHKIETLRPAFTIFRHLTSLYPLKNLLQKPFQDFLSNLFPRVVSPELICLHRSLLAAQMREQRLSFIMILKSTIEDESMNQGLDLLSPIKFPSQIEETEKSNDQHIRCSTMNLPSNTSMKKHNTSRSGDAVEFKKYLMWWKEFKTKGVSKKPREGLEKRPPWKPSGVGVKVKGQDDSFRKKLERRRDYSESLRSSRSSFSSEDSFCKKIGWDKWDYIQKIKNRKSKDLSKLVSAKSMFRTINKRFRKYFIDLRSLAMKNPSNLFKKLVGKSWKLGVFNIGLGKLFNVFRRQPLKLLLSALAIKRPLRKRINKK
ncbi:hypothetical protein SteCoe_13437 [Stentor coeruleus]|uniref:Uncharacterized protein n=1 Tax=Stentor coeruleus TaxID=5963 RepID=A0A1R2C8E8_9CILI|nr:hypothetical protein SteCoe_13437 [Stentor coeruleus]